MGNPEEDTESLRLHNRLDIAENNTYDWKISNCRERSMLRLQELLTSPLFSHHEQAPRSRRLWIRGQCLAGW